METQKRAGFILSRLQRRSLLPFLLNAISTDKKIVTDIPACEFFDFFECMVDRANGRGNPLHLRDSAFRES